MLSEERREKILRRVEPLLRAVDPDVRLIDVILDSTREQLAFVMQKGEWPIVVGLNWLDYVSHRDDELREQLAAGLARRLEKARSKPAEEEP
ncbi:MAG: hypothetical protein K6U09_08485 [Acidobacteriia bacterium]|jgi:hypothetical protein|nr:hypothetical protein [Terriglobia bacterium]